ncbi:MAG: DUF262 domain-containing protein [Thermomicrobiales bacterium]
MPTDVNHGLKIESSDLNLNDLLKDFYTVPDFQREYVWERENVDRLLQDVYDEFYEEPGKLSKQTEYFIGSVVVCRGDDQAFQLIDGQQRMTICYLVICAIRDAIMEAGETPKGNWYQSLIASSSFNSEGDSVYLYRLALQYADSDGVLVKIADENGPDTRDIAATTNSVRHLLDAYSAIREFLTINFEDDIPSLKRFLVAFTTRLKLIRIVTPDLSRALKVFETINDRGVGLTAMDLLKNLLFINTPTAQYAELKDKWKLLIDTLDRCGEKPLRFLRYFIMANFETDLGRPLREDQIYAWFTKHQESTGISGRPIAFLELLVQSSLAYARFARAEDSSGNSNRYLQNLASFSGNARQHYILLLAGRHLPEDGFSLLCQHLENLFFCYTITRTPTKSLEYNFARWSRSLREAKSSSETQAFLEQHIVGELRSLSQDFNYALLHLDQTRIQQYRMRYVLAKLAQYVDFLAWNNEGNDHLGAYLDRSVHVEHILPDQPSKELRNSFDLPDEYDDYKIKLGNLTLLEQTINTSISNGTYMSKREGYANSKYLITKAIFERPQVGSNTQYNKAIDEIPQFKEWTSSSILERQGALAKLARKVWSIPDAESASPIQSSADESATDER